MTEPVDKFRHNIYPKTYQRILRTAEKLRDIGYSESEKKPNLFHFKDNLMVFFADMRGTDVVPIWEDSSPMIYWYKGKDMDEIETLNHVLAHFELLGAHSIRFHLSFYEQAEQGSLTFDNYDYVTKYLKDRFNLPLFLANSELSPEDQNGTCYSCGKKFSQPGFFCSDDCRLRFIRRYIASHLNSSNKFCELCKMRILEPHLVEEFSPYLTIEAKNKGEVHHISYFPEKTMVVCDECHQKIHNSNEFPHLRPPEGESKRFYKGSIR